jgi:hypothetical protein
VNAQGTADAKEVPMNARSKIMSYFQQPACYEVILRHDLKVDPRNKTHDSHHTLLLTPAASRTT